MGCLFIITAPSGAGKTSLVRALLQRIEGLALSISCTTRAPRHSERDGHDYHFLSEEEFHRRREQGEFLEWAEVYGNYYATPKAPIEAALAGEAADLIFEVDWQGARNIRRAYPEAASIYILPPSPAELEARLRARATDSEATILRRLQQLSEDIGHVREFDYVIVNDIFDRALDQLVAIVTAERCRSRLLKPDFWERFHGPNHRR